MNGHMIKYELYEKSNNFQCHNNNVGTFVVSISHYMRAYFNYQALLRGENFKLPSDAGYLNCVLLQQTAYSDTKLYAKIGCLEKDSSTSTKLQLHVYTDKQCSTPYDDGQDSSKFRKGYNINGYYFSSKVSFRPPFYSCMNCKPETISDSFSKRKTFWYDDDAAANGYQIYKYFDDWLDDYFLNDDAYFKVQEFTNNEVVYTRDDDDNRNKVLAKLRKALKQIDKLESDAEWPRILEELEDALKRFDELNEKYGNEKTSSVAEQVKKQVETVIKNKDSKVGEMLSGQIRAMNFALVDEGAGVALEITIIKNYDDEFEMQNWSDKNQARSLINQAKQIISTNPTKQALKPIVQQLYGLLPNVEKGGMTDEDSNVLTN